jgi:hypothetical protein
LTLFCFFGGAGAIRRIDIIWIRCHRDGCGPDHHHNSGDASLLRMWKYFVFVWNVVHANGDMWSSPNPTVFNIGGVLSSNDSEYYFKETIAVSLTLLIVQHSTLSLPAPEL